MKVALICNAAEQLGIQHISASLLPHGHKTKLFLDPALMNDRVVFNYDSLERLFSMRSRLTAAVADWKPDMIGISTVTINYQWAKDIGTRLKQVMPDVPIIVGGAHAMLSPEVVIDEPCFDMVCVAEGEAAVAELANSLQDGHLDTSINDIWFRNGGEVIKNPMRNLNQDLDSLPIPDRTIFEPYFSMSDSLLTMSLRGCIYRCSYCSHNVLRDKFKDKGRYVRRKSPEAYIEELLHFERSYDPGFYRIYDDIFTHDVEWLERFAPLYSRKIGKPFFCLGHPKYLKRDAVRLIKEAGCRWIQVGVESLNPTTRLNVLNRPETNEEIFQSVKMLEKYNLRYELDFIFGLPGDDRETFENTLNFLKKTQNMNRVSALVLSYLPKTEIINHSIERNQISAEDVEQIEQGMEGCQTDKGSLRSESYIKMAEEYNILYRLCAFLSEKQVDYLRKTGGDKILTFFGPMLIHFIRLLGMDTVDKIFLKLFARQFMRVVFQRRNYYAEKIEKP